MIDALGNVQSVLVVGGTSQIAMATIERLANARLDRVVLAGRISPELDDAADRVRALGINDVSVIPFDAVDPTRNVDELEQSFDDGDIDLILFTVGVFANQDSFTEHPGAATIIGQVNYTGPACAALTIAARVRRQGHGTLVFITDIASTRTRTADYVYASSQAALDTFAVGLGDSLRKSGAKVVVIRVAAVATRFRPAQPNAVSVHEVAGAIAQAISKKKSSVVYVPSSLKAKTHGLKAVPSRVFR